MKKPSLFVFILSILVSGFFYTWVRANIDKRLPLNTKENCILVHGKWDGEKCITIHKDAGLFCVDSCIGPCQCYNEEHGVCLSGSDDIVCRWSEGKRIISTGPMHRTFYK